MPIASTPGGHSNPALNNPSAVQGLSNTLTNKGALTGKSPSDAQVEQSSQFEKNVIDYLAQKNGIPTWVLEGVYGMETDFGRDVATSNAGAMGLMQFIPSTAKIWHYPMTNTPTLTQAVRQVDAAAKYLKSLYNTNGRDWNAAIEGYGGGYGASQVQAKAQEASSLPSDTVSTSDLSLLGNTASALATGQASGPLGGIWNGTIGGLSSLLGDLTSKSFWMMVGLILLGGIFLIMGTHMLMGGK